MTEKKAQTADSVIIPNNKYENTVRLRFTFGICSECQIFEKVSNKEKIQGKVMRFFMGREKFKAHVQKNMVDLMITGQKKALEKDKKKNNEQ